MPSTSHVPYQRDNLESHLSFKYFTVLTATPLDPRRPFPCPWFAGRRCPSEICCKMWLSIGHWAAAKLAQTVPRRPDFLGG